MGNSDQTQISQFSLDERRVLLDLARQSVQSAAAGSPPPAVDLANLPEQLRVHQACFVSLYKAGQLRGCTGVLLPREPLAYEVICSAKQTALTDPRFPPVILTEVPLLNIEISVLTPPIRLKPAVPSDIQHLIRPGIDGVTLARGFHRATFLPQVWERVPDPVRFLDMLCQKMGLPGRSWATTDFIVEVYQVEEFSELNLKSAQSPGM